MKKGVVTGQKGLFKQRNLEYGFLSARVLIRCLLKKTSQSSDKKMMKSIIIENSLVVCGTGQYNNVKMRIM